jgi:adenylate cyclase
VLRQELTGTTTGAELNELLGLLQSETASRRAYCMCVLAEACLNAGQVTAGLSILGSMAAGERRAGMATEILRIEGELMLKNVQPSVDEAKHRFREAIDLARARAQKSLELRAAMSLARVLERESRHEEAHAALAGVCGWFTEGLDTADLRRAKTLLEALA